VGMADPGHFFQSVEGQSKMERIQSRVRGQLKWVNDDVNRLGKRAQPDRAGMSRRGRSAG
jgi:hypothetical protein